MNADVRKQSDERDIRHPFDRPSLGSLVGSLDAAEVVLGALESLLLVDGGITNDGGVGNWRENLRSERSDELGAEKRLKVSQ